MSASCLSSSLVQVRNGLRSLWENTEAGIIANSSKLFIDCGFNIIDRRKVCCFDLHVAQSFGFEEDLSLALNLSLDLNLPLVVPVVTRFIDHL